MRPPLRLATWNSCGGPLERKLAAARTLAADLLVLPECPAFPERRPGHLWVGTSPRKGLAVIANDHFSLRRATRRPLPEFVLPLMVEGPVSFLLLAVWMKGKGPDRYVRGLNRAVDACRALIRKHPTVVMGDFNSNAIWDHEHPAGLDHSGRVLLRVACAPADPRRGARAAGEHPVTRQGRRPRRSALTAHDSAVAAGSMIGRGCRVTRRG